MAIRWSNRLPWIHDDRKPDTAWHKRTMAVLMVLQGFALVRAGFNGVNSSLVLEVFCLAGVSALIWEPRQSAIGPATLATLVWITRTGGMTMADGPFDGVGMVVTSRFIELLHTAGWPLMLLIAAWFLDRRSH